MAIDVDYYDLGSATLTLQYDSIGDGEYKSAGSIALGNKDTWKQFTFYLDDAYFGNRQNNGADFRISAGVGTTFYLDLIQLSAMTPLGDLNFDGQVNIFDVNLVSQHWGESGPTADGNGDMMVNIFDINLISANWTGGGGVTAVPEPSSASLAMLSTVALALAVRRRWRKASAMTRGIRTGDSEMLSAAPVNQGDGNTDPRSLPIRP